MNKVLYYILAGLIFLFPLFFLPITQEFYATNKIYLLVVGALAVLLFSGVSLLLTKKINWRRGPLDGPVVLFVLTAGLSLLLSSPNKIAALTNLNFGLVMVVALGVVFFAVSQSGSRSRTGDYFTVLNLSALVLAVVSIFFFIQPFKDATLPQAFQFLKSPYFTPIGGRIDLAVFMGFMVTLLASRFIGKKDDRPNALQIGTLIVVLLSFILTVYSIFKPLNEGLSFVLPPYRLSWYAAIEALKTPMTALFGVGLDNFASLFTRVKDQLYNATNLWQISSFGVSRSTVLHVMSVAGLFGLVSLLLMLFVGWRTLQKLRGSDKQTLLYGFGYLVLVLLFVSPSVVIFFLLFLVLALINKSGSEESAVEPSYLPLGGLLPVYFILLVAIGALIAAPAYYLGRIYASEVYFKKSLEGLAARNAASLYNNQRRAIQLNPYNENYRVTFSQTNLLLANNIAARARQTQQNEAQGQQVNLTEQQRQSIAQFIQAGIREAKAAVILNNQKASNWENLARTYRGIINVAKDADVWTLSSYQRAITLDPRNPVNYLNLGGGLFLSSAKRV